MEEIALEPPKAKKEAYCNKRDVMVISIRRRSSSIKSLDRSWKSIKRGILVARDCAIRKWTTRIWIDNIVPRICY